MSARDQVLARVRAALGSVGGGVEVPREYRQAGAERVARAGTVELFERRAVDYGARVRHARPGQLGAVLAAAAREHEAARLCAPAAHPLEIAGAEVVIDDPPLSPEELDRMDGVVTGCALAIAETGSIVLDGGPRSGRRAISLVPDLHLCVIDVDQIVVSVPDAIGALAGIGRQQSPLTFISGPSATSDIEFLRVEGVHGPRRLEIVIAGDESGPEADR